MCSPHSMSDSPAMLGALSVLPMALSTQTGICLFAGEVREATLLVDQVQIVTDALDVTHLPNAAFTVAAFRGRAPGPPAYRRNDEGLNGAR